MEAPKTLESRRSIETRAQTAVDNYLFTGNAYSEDRQALDEQVVIYLQQEATSAAFNLVADRPLPTLPVPVNPIEKYLMPHRERLHSIIDRPITDCTDGEVMFVERYAKLVSCKKQIESARSQGLPADELRGLLVELIPGVWPKKSR